MTSHIPELGGHSLIGGHDTLGGDTCFNAVDPQANRTIAPDYHSVTTTEIDAACQLASDASIPFRHSSPALRARLLEHIAEGIDNHAAKIVERAAAETGLPRPRLDGERQRTSGQCRHFAQLLRDGQWQGRRHDAALPQRQPQPRPELRSLRVAVGPVAVFSASNFPLAFSVAGGDTVSALAAGAPVIVKSHPAHPGTAEYVGRIVQAAVQDCGLPAGVFALLYGSGHDTGSALVQHPQLRAVGFTGSRRGGLALMEIAARRPRPIPVFAEMSSINPVFVLPEAMRTRAANMARDFIASMCQSAGQLCTSPGVIVAVDNPDMTNFIATASAALQALPPQVMLSPDMHNAYNEAIALRNQQDGVTLVATAQATNGSNQCLAQLHSVSADRFLTNPILAEEAFGAAALIVRCHSAEQMLQIAASLEGQLTACVHVDDSDMTLAGRLMPLLEERAGRLLCNAFPTGVEVCHSMVHGGPFPATSDGRSTSVGSAAIERFLRPVCYQNMPAALLPEALR